MIHRKKIIWSVEQTAKYIENNTLISKYLILVICVETLLNRNASFKNGFSHMSCLILLYLTIKPVFIFSLTVCWQFATRCLFAPVASWSLLFSRSYYWAWKLSRCMKPLTSARISTWMKRHDTLWKKSAAKDPLPRQYCDDFRKLKDVTDFCLRSFVERDWSLTLLLLVSVNHLIKHRLVLDNTKDN